MDMKSLASQARIMSEAGSQFLIQYDEIIKELLNRKDLSAEESLQKEIMIELTEHIYGIRHIAEYLERTKLCTGTLSRNKTNEIEFNGEVLPLMTELEVYVRDEFLNQNVWTRVFVGGFEKTYLVGLKKDFEIKDIPARIRE